MDVDLDFKTQFLNLGGIHYNERKKNFYKLLKSTSPQILAQVDIEPRNHLERIFFVDILIRSKQIDKLITILKEGNGVLTSKILKQKWFFEEAFQNMSEDVIVNEFLPNLSFSTRMKVLKKMSLSFTEEKMDKMFDYVLQRYGLFIAQQFLFSCSSGKITDVLRNNEINLNVEQLKRILDKDSGLVKLYFEEYKKNTGKDFDDHFFLSYLPWKYPNLYFEFAPYLQGSGKAGRHTTKTILNIDKEYVLRDVKKLQTKFNVATIIREVKDFNEQYMCKFFPDDMNKITMYLHWRNLLYFVKKYPLKRRWEVFSNGFKKAYNKDLINHLELVVEEIAETFPTEIRRMWAEVKYRETNDITYIKYFDPKPAFILLKEKINVTSKISERASMFENLVKICHSNKDYKTYEETLKYICLRHRNEENYLRVTLTRAIARSIDYDLSTETLWNYINELIDVFRVKGESLPYENMSQYLIFTFKKKINWDQPVAQFVKDAAKQTTSNWTFVFFDEEPNIKASVMKEVEKYLPEIDIESRKKTLSIALMAEIINFNKNHTDIAIDLNYCPVIIHYVKEVLAKRLPYDEDDIACIESLVKNNYGKDSKAPLKVFYMRLVPKGVSMITAIHISAEDPPNQGTNIPNAAWYLRAVYEDSRLLDILKSICTSSSNRAIRLHNVLMDVIKRPRTTEFQNNLLDYYFTEYLLECQSHCVRTEDIKYFMTREPDVLKKYFDQILPLEVPESIIDYSVIKLYSHLELDQRLMDYLKLVFPTSTGESRIKLIDRLSKIVPSQDFINLMEAYIPQKKKLDYTDSEQKSLYEGQCATAKALKNLDEVVKLTPLLPSFCQGDYLQSSLGVLYKVLYRISEDQAASVINILVDRAVSTRKHAVYLSLEVLSQKSALELFSTTASKETNVSAQKYLFQGVLKYFLKNPSENLLDMVVTNMTFVDKNDNELLELLTNSFIEVSGKFKPVFVEQVWNFLDVIEKKNVNVVVYRNKLLSGISSYDITFFMSLKEAFCRNIIKQHFLSNNDALLRAGNMYDFVAKYLLAYKDDEHFTFVFEIVRNYKRIHWESNNKSKLKYIFTFFDHVCKVYALKDITFLILFKSYWEQIFNHEECFSEYVLLRLFVLYKETASTTEFCEKLSTNFQELVLEYGPYINDFLLKCIQRFFSIENRDTFTAGHFAAELLKVDTNELNCFIASSLIANEKQEEIRSEVINILNSVNDFTVRIRCNDLLKK